jgi:hypothetical protein
MCPVSVWPFQVAICGVIDFSNFTKAYKTSKVPKHKP